MISKHEILAIKAKGKYFDCGDKIGYLESILSFAKKNPLFSKDFKQILEPLNEISKLFFLHRERKKIEYIDSQLVFENSVNILEKEREIAIDTEFIWRETYYPILSLIQISSPTHIFIFDILKLEKSQRLRNIFANKDITKVFHSMRGDISILYHFYKENFVNVYDTRLQSL